MLKPQILLASSSPRRKELLQQMGITFHTLSPDIDEQWSVGECAEQHVLRLAQEKARRGWQMQVGTLLPVLGSDTVVVCDEEILGKPSDREDACRMMGRLSGRAHRVLTAVAVIAGDKELTRLSETRVFFRDVDAGEIDAYWQSGEPVGKAGGYAVQGLGALFVERIEGSFSGVMGLPIFETAELLKDFSIDVLHAAVKK